MERIQLTDDFKHVHEEALKCVCFVLRSQAESCQKQLGPESNCSDEKPNSDSLYGPWFSDASLIRSFSLSSSTDV